ncbi:MAG: hypothetical protein CSA52_01960 [Gammaproteobacteria bacterium]|nr:MAG: hypothetical protein CSB48_07580 [Pseudomonadota bacterium]PIE38519.1 MAG: hypothetical protein CSA52_01960 [Gammaproteobacteria bacterium]
MTPNERSDYLLKEHLELIINCADELSHKIAALSETVTQTLLSDGKVFTLGNGPCAPIAEILANSMVDQFERERPGFPAICLSNEHSLISQYAKERRFNELAARKLRTLGAENDMLILLSIEGDCSNLVQAMQTAHDKGMAVALITGPNSSNLASIMDSNDLEICLGSNTKSRVIEFQMISINILLDLIDCALFGPPTESPEEPA